MAEFKTNPEILQPENLVYKRTDLLTEKALSYCPGCGCDGHITLHDPDITCRAKDCRVSSSAAS